MVSRFAMIFYFWIMGLLITQELGQSFASEKASPLNQLNGAQSSFFNDKPGKMWALFELPPEKVNEQLEKWPRYQEMSLEEKQRFNQRLTRFRQEREKEALEQAKQRGIKVSPEKRSEYVTAYWASKREMEEMLRAEMSPRRRELEGKAVEKLKKQFGSENP